MRSIPRKPPTASLLVTILLLPALPRSEAAVQAWVQRYNGPANLNDKGTAVALDASNNVVVAGYAQTTARLDDYATIKYSSAGLPLWTNLYNGTVSGAGVDYGNAVAVDSNNDVLVTGNSFGNGTGPDYATIKYSSTGTPLWIKRYNRLPSSQDLGVALAVDVSNNVAVTGYSVEAAGYSDYITIMYSSDGLPLWTNSYNGPANYHDYATAAAVDGSNNVIVTGYSASGANNYDYATIKYSTAGAPLWTNRYNGPANSHDYTTALAVDGSNNVIVTGYSIAAGSGYDYATIKYSSTGEPLWTNRYSGTGYDYAYAMAVDHNNNVIVTGDSIGSGSSYDYATIKYSSTGEPLWTNRYNGPGNSGDYARAARVDGNDNVIVAGYSTGSGSSYDYATINYSGAGVPLWTNRYDGPTSGGDWPTALAVDGNNDVIVTGYSTDNGSYFSFATVKYASVPPPVLTGLQPTNGSFQMRVDGVLQPGTLVIEASTNLASWQGVFTNTAPTNSVLYTDPDIGGVPARFYRAFQFP